MEGNKIRMGGKKELMQLRGIFVQIGPFQRLLKVEGQFYNIEGFLSLLISFPINLIHLPSFTKRKRCTRGSLLNVSELVGLDCSWNDHSLITCSQQHDQESSAVLLKQRNFPRVAEKIPRRKRGRTHQLWERSGSRNFYCQ